MTDSLFQGNLNSVNPASPVGRWLRGEPPAPRDPLGERERNEARELAKTESCRWCGGLHARACPRVKSMTFHTDGQTVLSVEFWRQDEWLDDGVVWPEELHEEVTGD